MRISGSTIINLLMLVIFAGMLYLSWDYPPASRRVPLFIAMAGLIFCLSLLIREIIIARHRPSPQEAVLKTDDGKKADAPTKRQTAMLLWVFMLLGVILVLGFWVGIPVFLIVFMRFFGHESWKLSTAFAGGTWLALYLIFHVGLKVSLYGGVFELAFF